MKEWRNVRNYEMYFTTLQRNDIKRDFIPKLVYLDCSMHTNILFNGLNQFPVQWYKLDHVT